jgi:hypothetical protein
MGLYRISFIIGEPLKPDTQTKISKMIEVENDAEAIAKVKADHPTDLVKITSVSQLR